MGLISTVNAGAVPKPLDLLPFPSAGSPRPTTAPCGWEGLNPKFNRMERWVLALEPMSLELIKRRGTPMGSQWEAGRPRVIQVEVLGISTDAASA